MPDLCLDVEAPKQLVRERKPRPSNWLFWRHIRIANRLSAVGQCVRILDEGTGII
jgi:hypothetical protein